MLPPLPPLAESIFDALPPFRLLRIPVRWMFVGVGLMVIVWSLWALRKVFG